VDKTIAVISDVHSNFQALYAVYRSFYDLVDEIWFLGDLFGGGGEFFQVYSAMCDMLKPSVWLLGNHDLAVLGNERLYTMMSITDQKFTDEEREFINPQIHKELGKKRSKMAIGSNKKILLSHAVPGMSDEESVIHYEHRVVLESRLDAENEILHIREKTAPQSNIWLLGHSHRQLAWQFNGDEWSQMIDGFGHSLRGLSFTDVNLNGEIVRTATVDLKKVNEQSLILLNPGSVGKPRDGNRNGQKKIAKYLLLRFTGDILSIEFRLVPYGER